MGIQQSIAKRPGQLLCLLAGLGSACAQGLELPFDERAQASDGGQAATSGITGAAGAGSEDEDQRKMRLPVPERPTFATFGGAGSEAGEAGRASTGGHAGGGDSPSSAGGSGAGELEPPLRGIVFISEYVEGAGSLKALELYALEPTSLEGCAIWTHYNGKTEPSTLALHGDMQAGSTYVLCSSALSEIERARCQRSTNLTFNGNDAIALACDHLILDAIGQIGVDPGEAWGEGATADHALRRNCSVRVGRVDGSQPFSPAAEWSVHSADLFADLGVHSCQAP